jgi:hypothetical protein
MVLSLLAAEEGISSAGDDILTSSEQFSDAFRGDVTIRASRGRDRYSWMSHGLRDDFFTTDRNSDSAKVIATYAHGVANHLYSQGGDWLMHLKSWRRSVFG